MKMVTFRNESSLQLVTTFHKQSNYTKVPRYIFSKVTEIHVRYFYAIIGFGPKYKDVFVDIFWTFSARLRAMSLSRSCAGALHSVCVHFGLSIKATKLRIWQVFIRRSNLNQSFYLKYECNLLYQWTNVLLSYSLQNWRFPVLHCQVHQKNESQVERERSDHLP